ncbi:MAG: phosphatidylserine decarboxylase family protein, partial [Alphaproteobacteria bacterium]
MASDILETVRAAFVPIHREGWRFIAIFAVLGLAMGWLWPP